MRNLPKKYAPTLMVIAMLLTILPGCVAKKKFVEMESYRNKAELRVKELSADVANLQNEFNEYKNEFHYNNFTKDQTIDSLHKVIGGLNANMLSNSASIDDQISSFQMEKRRLNQLLAEKDREIRIAQRDNEELLVQINDLKNEAADLNLKLKNAESTTNAGLQKTKLQDDELVNLKSELQKKSSDIKKLQLDLTAKNDQIETLKNQVKLLKSQTER